MIIEIWGQNKPILRSITKDGKLKAYKTVSYSSHIVTDSMEKAIIEMKELFNKNWDVKIDIREA